MRVRVADLRTIEDVEQELDVSLQELRDLDAVPNLNAKAATEYRIGRLRLRKIALEWR